MLQKRPLFRTMRQHFSTVHVDVPRVGKIIGGAVEKNIEAGIKDPNHGFTNRGFTNACAIRLSYCLHHSGIIIPTSQKKWATVSGRDGKQYIYRVADMARFLESAIGKPDKTITSPSEKSFKDVKGIIIFHTHGWTNATGHATLWDSKNCIDHCYFTNAIKASIWVLK